MSIQVGAASICTCPIHSVSTLRAEEVLDKYEPGDSKRTMKGTSACSQALWIGISAKVEILLDGYCGVLGKERHATDVCCWS